MTEQLHSSQREQLALRLRDKLEAVGYRERGRAFTLADSLETVHFISGRLTDLIDRFTEQDVEASEILADIAIEIKVLLPRLRWHIGPLIRRLDALATTVYEDVDR